MKRYLRIDFEFENDDAIINGSPIRNLRQIISKDMPYIKMILIRESSNKEFLNDGKHREK